MPRVAIGPILLLPTALLPAALVACGGTSTNAASVSEPAPSLSPEPVAAPDGPLPPGVTPTAYRLALEVVPRRERFRGDVAIDLRLDAPTRRFWIHGAELTVDEATLTPAGADPLPVTWSPDAEVSGVAGVVLPTEVPAGEATLRVRYTAPFDRKLKGLYRVDEGDDHYAFTQFEATSARYAFPSFDEPRFKTPFETTLLVEDGDVALSNTPEVGREPADDGLVRVRFAPTPPIPTYLVAMAVGPLDVVEGTPIPANDVRSRPVPLRGVAAKGKGGDLSRALEGTGPLLASLEDYFGIPYPYAKLDIVAVPDFASGAMENVGLITFREYLLLLGDDPGAREERAFTYVMAHELAHQWFGNLVTMPWWDDIWLNEAFATWMGHRVVDEVTPEYRARLQLLGRVHGTMARDSLASARQIRQPIETTHDIRNAFDPITYSKGGGVLSMVEAWIGPAVFRRGLQRYMTSHRFGTATADDLLQALDATSGKDVSGPFRTFLFQPGVPVVDVTPVCSDDGPPRVTLRQMRYVPLGSDLSPDQRWSIPVCVRYGGGDARPGRACGTITEGEGALTLGEASGCPSWVHPNADAAGYYRFLVPDDHREALRTEAWPDLSPAERLALVDSLEAGVDAGARPVPTLYEWLETFARDETRPVAMAPARVLREARDRLVPDELTSAVDALGRKLYRRRMRQVGLRSRPGEAPETKLLRASMASFLALDAEDPGTRRELAAAARRVLGIPRGGGAPTGPHLDRIPRDLLGPALAVAVEDGGTEVFEAVESLVRGSDDAFFRQRALRALGHARGDALVTRARGWTLDPAVRGNEVTVILEAQMDEPDLRAGAWEWLQGHFDEVVARVPTTRAGRLPWLAAGFCDDARAVEVEAFFSGRIDALDGGPRNLAGTLEAIRLCAARREAHAPAARRFFAR